MRGFSAIFLFLFFLNLHSQNYVYQSSISENDVNSETDITFNINTDGSIQAFQADLIYDSNNFTFIDYEVFDGIMNNHNISVSEFDSNTLRIIVYSSSNDFIEEGDFNF